LAEAGVEAQLKREPDKSAARQNIFAHKNVNRIEGLEGLAGLVEERKTRFTARVPI
jgi:hypothetical protein